MSIAKTVADAVVAELNSHAWDESFTGAHREFADATLDFDTLRVSVIDTEIRTTQAARRIIFKDIVINIGVQQRVANDAARVETLKDLCEDILDWFALDAAIGYTPVEAGFLVHRSSEQVREHRHFIGVIQLVYRTQKNATT